MPHDFVLEGKHTPHGAIVDSGFLPYTKGWYKCKLTVPSPDVSSKRYLLRFEGVLWASHVFISSLDDTDSSQSHELLGSYLDGYTPFTYDITEYL